MSKHTPGPWRVGRSGKDYPYQIEAMDGRGITSWRGISRPASAEGEANASLISAAPELLEALEGMLEIYGVSEQHMWREPFVSSTEVECCNEARAAIAKAKGESA